MSAATLSPAESGDLYRRELPFVTEVLRRTGFTGAWLEDAAHEVLLTAWRSWSTFDDDRPLRPWLMGIAVHAAADLQRRAYWRCEHTGVDVERRDERESAEEALIGHERQQCVRRALVALSAERRAVLTMHELDEVRIPQVARALNVPLNTAYLRLRLARRDLAAQLGRWEPELRRAA